ncbi:hypothetical protein BBP40_009886 [Aspergillus hancockii]|nr:hypothetical protein BBP40_009886 [Aspergillus hancockii]
MSTPENHPYPNSPPRSGIAIVTAHPWTSIKEQAPANYARVLSQAGFTCLAYDAAYQGESKANLETSKIPASGTESACASGGNAPLAAQTDLRLKAVATTAAILKTQLEAAAKDWESDITGEKTPLVHLLPERIGDMPADYPEVIQGPGRLLPDEEGASPRAQNVCLAHSCDLMTSMRTKAATKWYSEDAVAVSKPRLSMWLSV